jgi:arylsulfatase
MEKCAAPLDRRDEVMHRVAAKPEAIKDWDKLSADEKKLFTRQMEVFAAFCEYADYEIGELINALRQTGQFDNTLIFYILGDNGTSAEGGMNGMFNELTYFNLVPETVEDQLKHYDEWGGPTTYPHMAAGWAVAGDTPFTWTKQVPSNYGGTRNGMIVSWPGHVSATDKVRSQWHHVIDVEPTALEATHLPQPKTVNGIVQEPVEGVSMMYTFEHPDAETSHKTQYFEIFGNRAIYNDGWFAGTIHKAPWESSPRAKLREDKWELYDTRKDFSLSNDVAASNPAKLKEMQALFLSEAPVGDWACVPRVWPVPAPQQREGGIIFIFVPHHHYSIRPLQRRLLPLTAQGFPLRPVQAKRCPEWSVGCRQPIRFQILLGLFVLHVDRVAAILVALEST